MKELINYCRERDIDYEKIKKYCNETFMEVFKKLIENRIPFGYIDLFRFLTTQYTSRFYRELKEKGAWELLLSIIISRAISNKEFPTSIFITTQTYLKGMGYYLTRIDIKDDIIRSFKDLLNSFYIISGGNLYIIICEGILKEYLSKFIRDMNLDENGFNYKYFQRWLPMKIIGRYGLIIRDANLICFCLLNYFLSNFKRFGDGDYAKVYFVSKRLINRRTFFFPNIHRIYKIFYEGDICYVIKNGVKLYPRLASFIFSMFIDHEKYRDKVESNVGKLVNILFNELRIDGRILNEIVIDIIKYVKKEKKKKVIHNLSFVLSRLYNIMEYKLLELWSETLGGYILSEDYRKVMNITEEDSRKIIERIIDEIKVEELQGRFWNKLLLLIKKYDLKIEFSPEDVKKYTGIDVKLSIDLSKFLTKNLIGDKFYHTKALIISGLLKSLYR